jgi:MFS family permease
LQEVVTSWVTLGALVGALIAGGLADRLGRQRTMVIGGALFAVGALGESLAPGTWILVISRFVIGFGVGMASVAGPLYAAEMAPSSVRGRYVSSYQLAITIGILLADIADAVLSPGGHRLGPPRRSSGTPSCWSAPSSPSSSRWCCSRSRSHGSWSAGRSPPSSSSPSPGSRHSANIFAGLVLLLSHPLRVGDTIRLRSGALGGQHEGTVTEIGITYLRAGTGG